MTEQNPPGWTYDTESQRWVPAEPVEAPRKRKGLRIALGAAAAIVVVAGLASIGGDEQEPESESTFTVAEAATSAPAPRTTPLPQTRELNIETAVEDDVMSSVYPDFLDSEGITLPERSARIIALAACNVLRDMSYPGDPDANLVLYGIGLQTVEEYPSLDMDDASTIIGGGVMVYCPEFEGSFGE